MPKKFLTKIKKIQLRKTIYPIILIVFFSVVAVVFVSSVRFLYRNMNKALILNEELAESQLMKLDLDKFNLVIKRLGFGELDNINPKQ